MSQTKILSTDQVEFFRNNGYVSPVRVMDSEQAASYRARLEAFEQAQGHPLNGLQRARSYLLFPWAYELLTHPRILDAVEDLIGPDIMVYHSTIWIKEARSPGFVSWHQDSTYFGLEPDEEVTAWLALSEASSAAGCMRVLPGSQKQGQLPSDLKPDRNNLLSSGQTVRFSFNGETDTVEMPLRPGEISLHHACAIHGSGGNDSNDRRIGICLNYIPAHVKPNRHLIDNDATCPAMLLRGKAHHDLFPVEIPRRPAADADTVSAAAHDAGVAGYRRMVQALGHQTAGRFD
ncbi:MAG: phytanoyl-CoA dioxygenase family protein [Hyphomicrobiaceae bacterium]